VTIFFFILLKSYDSFFIHYKSQLLAKGKEEKVRKDKETKNKIKRQRG